MQIGNGRVVLVKFKYVLAAGALATVLAGAASGKIANPAGWSADEAKAIAAWPAREATTKIDPAIEIRIAKIVKGMTF